MGGAAAHVDVHAVGGVVDHVGFRAKGFKYGFGNHPGGAVGAVQAHLHAFVGMAGQGNQIADVAVAPGGIIDGAADAVPGGVRRFGQFSVDVLFHLVGHFVGHFFPAAIDQLDAVIVVRVVAGGNHDAAVKALRAGHVGHGGGGGHVQQVHVRAAGRQSRRQGVFKHIAGKTGVLSNHDSGLVAPAIIISDVTAHLEGVLHRQVYVRFSAEAVGPKILAHAYPLFRAARIAA